MLIAQITDCHVVERGGLVADRVDSGAALARAVAAINALDPLPDLVLATGDLVNDARPAEYDRLVELLAPLTAPLLPVMGNHDDRSELRARFRDALPPGDPDQPIDFVVDDHELRLVVVDTTVPGYHHGQVTAEQMEWLDDRLGEAPDRPTLVVQHHPPFLTGIAFMDAYSLDGIELERAVIERHPQVEAIVAGHIHRAIHTRFGGTVASCWPSTAAPVALDLVGTRATYSSEPAGFALHRYEPGAGLVSHVVPLVDAERWVPTWAE